MSQELTQEQSIEQTETPAEGEAPKTEPATIPDQDEPEQQAEA
jgi:hypothetical protein